jgi:hypothetical protein
MKVVVARQSETPRPARRRSTIMLVSALALSLTLSASRAFAVESVAAPSTAYLVYLPMLAILRPLFMPVVMLQINEPVNLVNGSFEADTVLDWTNNPPCYYTGFTDPQGNQHPRGWDFYSPANGETMPFPTKMQQGSIVPAISGGPGEYVHKGWCQLPDDERYGGLRALILDGSWTYKAFRYGNPQALRLSQVLTGTPGLRMEVTGYILGETPDQPTGPKLEDDHFIASVQLGSVVDTRFYAAMIQHYDVPGNERNWNRYDLSATIPASGQLLLTIIVQQNWTGETDFFLDNFQALEWFLN